MGMGDRQPGTAIYVLNSHGPGSGGTVPLPQTLLAPQFALPLYSPAGAVTHGRAVGEVASTWGGVRRGTLLLPRLDYISTHVLSATLRYPHPIIDGGSPARD